MSGHNVLNELFKAFTPQGPGLVSLSASAAGVKIPEDQLVQFVVPTWGGVNNIIILPTPTPGKIVILAGAATGGELRSNAPATVGINGGTGTDAESAIAANMMAILICESTTNWKGLTIASNGTVTTLQVAAP